VREEGLPEPFPKRLRGTKRQDADAHGFSRRLRLSGERRGEKATR
jgi:hypothetical protein